MISIINIKKTFLLTYYYIINKLIKSFNFIIKELIKYIFYNYFKTIVIYINFIKSFKALIII